MGAMIGYYYSKQNDARLAEIEKKMEEQRQQMEFTNKMLAMMTNDQSASQRIQGVNVAMTVEKVDDKIVKALVKTLNEDPNTNVRLAALEALGKFHQEKNVREQLIQSLSIQKDPVIQIELIQLMVQMKEKSVVDDLQRIVDDVETMKAVKDEAYSGIMKLS
jgi:5'-3' exonuclease